MPTESPIATNTVTPASNDPNVLTSISPSNILVGETSQLTVSLNDIPAQTYTSTEFTCTYDSALVEVSNISVGPVFGPDAVSGPFGPQNGSFILAIAGSQGRKASGGGVAFTFDARGLQTGSTNIECKARVSEGQNVLQDIRSVPSTMTIAVNIPTPAATDLPASASIRGQVLASRPVTVRVDSLDDSVTATTTANLDGTFQITVPGGTYTITAFAEGFLGAQGSVTVVDGSNMSQPVVSLVAGDIDGNGVIDPFDELTIRMNYNNSTPAAADLNNDGVIDVLDLGILAGNYGRSGLKPWP